MQQLFCLPPTILFRFLFFLSFQPFLVLSPSTFVTSSSLPRQQKQHRPGKQRHGPVLWPLCVLADQLVVLLPSLAVVVCFVTAGLWITRADNKFFLFLLKHQTSGFFVRPTRCVVTSIYGLAQHRGFLHIKTFY